MLAALGHDPLRSASPRAATQAHPVRTADRDGRGWRPCSRSSPAPPCSPSGARSRIQSYDVGIRGFDSLWYHLPWAASFAQTGNVASLRFTDVEYLTPFYPATAELLHGLGIVLLGRDTLSPGFNLAVARAHAAGGVLHRAPARRRRRHRCSAPRSPWRTTMMDYSQAGSAANDVVAVFFLLAAVALLMTEPERPRPLVAGGGRRRASRSASSSPCSRPCSRSRSAWSRSPRAGAGAPTAGLWLGPLILAGGFWYARNLIAVGNPLPWTSLRGVLPDAGAAAAAAHRLLGRALPDEHRTFWSRFVEPALAAGLGRWWWAVLAVAVARTAPVPAPRAALGKKRRT